MRDRASARTQSSKGHVASTPAGGRLSQQAPPRNHQSRLTRAFLVATIIFVAVLGLTYYASGAAPRPVTPIVEEDLSILVESAGSVSVQATVSGMNELAAATVRVGCAAEQMLAQITAAEEAQEQGAAAAMHGNGAAARTRAAPRGVPSAATLRRYERELQNAVPALQLAVDALYTPLAPMLLVRETRPLPDAVSSLPRSVFSWTAAAAHVYGVVLPEYALHTDDTLAHATALLRAVNLLTWLAAHPSLMGWSGAPCRQSFATASNPWQTFCATSMETPRGTLVRRAAALEELIVLSPTYAPLRLHYAAVFVVNGAALSTTSTTALQHLRKQGERLAGYTAVEAFHRSVLTLLTAFATPLERVDAALRRSVEELLAGEMGTCEALRRPWGPHSTWPAPFHRELRPPLFDKDQVELLLTKLRLVVAPDSLAASHPGCV